MKLSRKILTFVAPIATVMTIAPIITSCNKETFSFNYGDSINCYKKEGTFAKVDVHSLSKVQEVAKANAQRWTATTVTTTQLTEYASSKKNVYYDLVASLAIVNNKQFALQWTISGDNVNIVYRISGEEEKTITNATFAYEEVTKTVEEKTTTYIALKINGNEIVQSYVFKDVTVQN